MQTILIHRLATAIHANRDLVVVAGVILAATLALLLGGCVAPIVPRQSEDDSLLPDNGPVPFCRDVTVSREPGKDRATECRVN